MDVECFFACSNTSPNLINCGSARVETIRDCSIRRGDGLIDKLHGLDSIRCHKSCVSTYASKHHLKRYITKKSNDNSATEAVVPPKRSRRLGTTKFSFKEHCVFCGEKCLPLDPRHPDRWRKVYQCRTTGGYKQKILLNCDERNDDLANEVRVRLSGAVTDLHAADAQYHNDCYKRFMSHKNIQAAAGTKSNVFLQDDPALDALICEMEGKKSHVWNSIEIHEAYTNYGGSKLSRKNLISNLFSHFGHDLLKLSGAGVANIFVFRSEAPHLLKLTDASDEIDMTVIAKTIKNECCAKTANRDTYHTRLTEEDVTNACSDTILRLLAELSPKLDNTLTALLIGNIITSVLTNRPTMLQITLGTIIRDKSLIEQCAEFGITCSYAEVLRFKKSVAHAASKEKNLQGLMDSRTGLIQTVADNFDTNIASPNGLKSTHSLALLLTQVQESTDHIQNPKTPAIKRLRKEDLKIEHTLPMTVERYNGPRKPDMPQACARQPILPLRILAAKIITLNRAQLTDYIFLKKITHDSSTPEYNGFNTEMARKQGHTIKPATKAIYTPLIDMKPSDPDTVMTAMVESQRLTQQCNQLVTLFTVDQQLYRVAVDVLWAYPQKFKNIIPRLGGMHMLMSFIGTVGTLMANSGLEALMNAAFGGVQKMLTGKKFPQCVRALRMVVEELLRDVIPASESFDELMVDLEER